MKKFKIKNYKGNIIESLSRFSNKFEGHKISKVYESENGKTLIIEASVTGRQLRQDNTIYKRGRRADRASEYNITRSNASNPSVDTHYLKYDNGVIRWIPAENIMRGNTHVQINPFQTKNPGKIHQMALDAVHDIIAKNQRNKYVIKINREDYHVTPEGKKGRASAEIHEIAEFDGYTWIIRDTKSKAENLTQLLGDPVSYKTKKTLTVSAQARQDIAAAIYDFKDHAKSGTVRELRPNNPQFNERMQELTEMREMLIKNADINPADRKPFPKWIFELNKNETLRALCEQFKYVLERFYTFN